jgi:hypothetical protein
MWCSYVGKFVSVCEWMRQWRMGGIIKGEQRSYDKYKIMQDLRFSRRWLWRMPSSWMWPSLQQPAYAGSSLADFSTLKMEAICSSEMSVSHKIYTAIFKSKIVVRCTYFFKLLNYLTAKHVSALVSHFQGRVLTKTLHNFVMRRGIART